MVAPPQEQLTDVRTAFLNLSEHPSYGLPMGIEYGRQKDIAFVVLAQNDSLKTPRTSLLVLNTTSFSPTVLRTIPLPEPDAGFGGVGIAVSADGDFAYLAAGQGAFVVNTTRAIEKESDPIVGFLGPTTNMKTAGDTAFYVTVSPNGRYLFVSQEDGPSSTDRDQGNIEVLALDPPTANGSVSGTFIDFVPIGVLVTDSFVSPNGSELYVVSEYTPGDYTSPGIVTILDVPTLETAPRKSYIGNITAECSPVRGAFSHNGSYLWVTNRGSNTVQVFDNTKILSDPADARVASIRVGTNPVSLVFVNNETRLLVADSNRFHAYDPKATAGITVLDVESALRNDSKANLGQFPSGLFPRDFALSPDGKTVLVSNTNSQQVMAIDLSTIP